MNTLVCVLALLLFTPQDMGKMESDFDKKANFSSFKTYAWGAGHKVFDEATHKLIVDTMDAQMTALGFTKVDTPKADVILKYHSVRESTVDLKALDKAQRAGQKDPPTKMVGVLVAAMYPAKSDEPLWHARTRRQVSDDPAIRTGEIQKAIAALFATYPGQKKK